MSDGGTNRGEYSFSSGLSKATRPSPLGAEEVALIFLGRLPTDDEYGLWGVMRLDRPFRTGQIDSNVGPSPVQQALVAELMRGALGYQEQKTPQKRKGLKEETTMGVSPMRWPDGSPPQIRIALSAGEKGSKGEGGNVAVEQSRPCETAEG
eukprot:CAMPEP_0194320056 /NCGR_PEP_ID=MMETSP0171-20130528/16444_1 /TAXON_ID=218684 /ORGANISM="Corethron pennatum, Strain L29A3" /LENGTH=150 /DNA_ID=CAMNT_0039077485 /DNA_START=208 /DNA_END=657 /DNA_ORIENTATION=-